VPRSRARAPRQRAEQERAALTLGRIIDTAIGIIEREGELAVTISRVVAETGLSRGAVYHHFADRDEIVRAAQFTRLTRQPGGDIAALRAAVRDAKDRDEFVGVVGLITAALVEPQRAPVRTLRAGVVATSARHPETADALRALESGICDDLTEVVREGQAKGFINAALDARAIAVVIEAVAFGLLLVEHIEPRPPRDALADAVGVALLAFLPGVT
jgi:AcrR family transcriptional regulator